MEPWSCSLQVLLDKLALDREKQTLEDENQKLKALLKQYLDGEWVESVNSAKTLCSSGYSFCCYLCCV